MFLKLQQEKYELDFPSTKQDKAKKNSFRCVSVIIVMMSNISK
jgi:hypothetical protein